MFESFLLQTIYKDKLKFENLYLNIYVNLDDLYACIVYSFFRSAIYYITKFFVVFN